MNLAEHKFYNALNVFYNGEYRELKKAAARYHSWEDALKKTDPAAYKNADAEWEKLLKAEVNLVLRDEKKFPVLLREIHGCPFGIYYKGSAINENETRIAIVGTRKATAGGKEIAKRFGKELAAAGIIVVSGLALGIDESAHSGTLNGRGKTIAVLAVGLDRVYPSQNSQLAKQILESGGTLISEYPLNSQSLPQRFIERNRIISGLSIAALIIEAPEDSGALHTANFALEQNREVLVIPGPINNPNYVGSHRLLKSGAALVTSTADVLENLGIQSELPQPGKLSEGLTDDNQKGVVRILKDAGEPLTIDKIAQLGKIETSEINRALTFLIIKGIIKESAGKYYLL